MNTNLEALVEAATGAHPIPEQEQAAATAAAAGEAIHQDEPKQSSTDVSTGLGTAGYDVPTPMITTLKEEFTVGVSEEATEEAIAASTAVERSVLEEATTTQSLLVHPSSSDIMENDNEVQRNQHFAYIEAANAAAAIVAEADVEAAAAAVAAVEASEQQLQLQQDQQQQQAHDTDAVMDVPTSMESVPTAYSQQPQDNENNDFANDTFDSGIAERRRKGWVKKTWDERLEELKAYKEIHGHANVPTISKDNPSLGHWVHDQRKQYRLYQEKKQTAMTPERIQLLEKVGFKWALQRHTATKSWNERFEELKKYKAEKGDCNVPIRYNDNPSLGQWVSTQRQEYGAKIKGRRSNTTQERVKALEDIGFQWFLRDTSKMAPRKSWESHFQNLVSFKEKHGHCDVRVRSKQHPTGSLGRWVEKQRHHYNTRQDGIESKITDEQIQRLEDLGFRWRVRNEKKAVAERREKLRAELEGQVHYQEEQEVNASAGTATEVVENVEPNAGSATVDPTLMNIDMLPVPDGNSELDAEMNRAAIAAVEAASGGAHNAMTMIGDAIDFHGVTLPEAGPLDSTDLKIEQEVEDTSRTIPEGAHDAVS
mmetsp:Transcript_17497/g.33168  ORF Transcript_17497/g.33168 Transcript_17497/m.33168 type:complete len:595 (+) Transcript_17497:598-2382(+)|eukprot:CAMPEP_0176492720 /NCGR_PEP_ID=MMETSP0200_2-20121128/9160_1 /TAXON_ID=947934 /ORGANISM="Chaetoceros sp., Strain GSL56" /LENGTH=594 /DNA_ID=CAMNT_0017890323 /DNA_START=564 /DNA_END=2348 /DNA_ORIENTATION=+